MGGLGGSELYNVLDCPRAVISVSPLILPVHEVESVSLYRLLLWVTCTFARFVYKAEALVAVRLDSHATRL